MMTVANYNKRIDERLANGVPPSDIIKDLESRKEKLSALVEESSICDKVLGRSEKVDTLLSQLNAKIDAEIFRVSNMCAYSIENYTPMAFEVSQDDLRLIKPVYSGDSYINVGIIIDEEASFKKDNSLLVRIVSTKNDSLLYQQAYIPKSGANSFVLPNYFNNDMVQLQIGYINKNERNTYHYISYIPYGRE
jgi:hypothetical protein